jgi:hypothetical protein
MGWPRHVMLSLLLCCFFIFAIKLQLPAPQLTCITTRQL